jgi:hypothetical protein
MSSSRRKLDGVFCAPTENSDVCLASIEVTGSAAVFGTAEGCFVDPGLCAQGGCGKIDQVDFSARHRVVADLKTTPLWLIRFNTILLWLNPGLSLAAVVLALLVIAEAGERSSSNRANVAPRIVRLADAPSLDLCRPSTLPPELRDLYLHD